MKIVKDSNLDKALADYNNFQECVIFDVKWARYGTEIDLIIDYIWTKDGAIR